MDLNEVCVEYCELLNLFKLFLLIFIGLWCIILALKMIKSSMLPYGRFNFSSSENKSKKEDIVIPEEKPYKINLSKDKSCK